MLERQWFIVSQIDNLDFFFPSIHPSMEVFMSLNIRCGYICMCGYAAYLTRRIMVSLELETGCKLFIRGMVQF